MPSISSLDVLVNDVNITQSQPSPSTSLLVSTSGVHFEINDEVMDSLLDIIKCPISIESKNWTIFCNDQCYDWISFDQHNTSELTTNRHRIKSGCVASDLRLKDSRMGVIMNIKSYIRYITRQL